MSMYDYPNAVQPRAYQTLMQRGLGVKNGLFHCAEVAIFTSSQVLIRYGNNQPPASLGSAASLLSGSRTLFMFQEPIEGCSNRYGWCCSRYWRCSSL